MLLAICAGNSPVTSEFPAQKPVTWSFDVFFDLCLIKRLSKQSRGWWFETPTGSLWRHCNVTSPLKDETKQSLVNNLWQILHASPFDRCLGIPYCMHSGLCNQHLGGKQPQLSCQQMRFSHKSYVLLFYCGTRIFHSKMWVEYMIWSNYTDPTSHIDTKLSWRKLQLSGVMTDIIILKPTKTRNFTVFNI